MNVECRKTKPQPISNARKKFFSTMRNPETEFSFKSVETKQQLYHFLDGKTELDIDAVVTRAIGALAYSFPSANEMQLLLEEKYPI